MSIDDNDLETEILTIEQNIENNSDDQVALSKFETCKELLIQRRSLLYIKKDLLQ
jgi:hypothetical protein